MLVDLGRNDLGRVCEYGRCMVDELMIVEAYSHVLHIVSQVSGTLRPDVTAMDALRAVLPAGTLSGAPKVRAMQIIDELEPHKRGSYGGAIGYLGFTGDLDTAIHIRTVVVKDGMVHVQAGGGTVADAKPDYEYEESREQGEGRVRGGRARGEAAGVAVSMRVLVIDNYDSFTYNLVQYLGELGAEPDVVRNDRAEVGELLERRPDRLVISPGPCTPDRAGHLDRGGASVSRGRSAHARVSAWGTSRWSRRSAAGRFAASRSTARTPRSSTTGAGVLSGLESPLRAGRYHSLVADPDLPDELELSASYERRRDGRAAPRAAGRGRPVPSRVGAHAARQGHTPELPRLMPNEILTRAIDEAVLRHAPDCRPRLGGPRRDHGGRDLATSETGAFLVALRAKGETVAELVGLARTMRRLAAHVEVARDDLVDTAGTGGGPSTFNISTTAALVAAGAGCAVAKHGNRSSTSRSGSADLLEALGVRIDLDPPAVARCIDEVGFGFMFAPRHHAAMKHVAPVRKELAVRTIFNFLGPLTNPAGASRQLLGVSDPRYQETIAEALVGLGCERAMVVRAEDGVDEIGLGGPTRVIEVRDAGTEEWFIEPGEPRCLLRRGRRDPRAGRPTRTPPRSAACSTGTTGPLGTSSC